MGTRGMNTHIYEFQCSIYILHLYYTNSIQAVWTAWWRHTDLEGGIFNKEVHGLQNLVVCPSDM